jgi:hypothetical protein
MKHSEGSKDMSCFKALYHLKFRFVFWDVLPCKIIVDRRFRIRSALMIEAARTYETSVDNYFTRQYIPEEKSELHTRRRENLKSNCITVWRN